MKHLRESRSRGFTLLEMLVALALLGVVMAGLLAALRSMGEMEARVDARLERLDEARTAHAFLGQILSRVSAANMPATDNPAKQVASFASDGASLNWVGIMPARPDMGGRHFFRLNVEQDPATAHKALVLRYAPWEPAKPFPEWDTLKPQIVLHNVTSFAVECMGEPPINRPAPPDWPKGWQTGWPQKDAVPRVVRLVVDPVNVPQPGWVFAPTALETLQPGLGGPAIGGGLMGR